jgi:hypothetical protein
MHQINTEICVGDLVQVLYRHDNHSYGIAVDLKEYTKSETQVVCGIMVKIFFLDNVLWYPLIWCKLVQKVHK